MSIDYKCNVQSNVIGVRSIIDVRGDVYNTKPLPVVPIGERRCAWTDWKGMSRLRHYHEINREQNSNV